MMIKSYLHHQEVLMNKLEDYVKITSPIPKKLCKKIITALKNSDWKEHTFKYYDGSNSKEQDTKPCKFIFDNSKHSQELMVLLHNEISNYIKSINSPYFTCWNGYTSLKFNKYSKGNSMEKHWDNIHTLFDGDIKGIPTLSIIGLLNNDFEGGEIEMFKDTKIKLKAGEIVIFPSNFLYPHMVCPVTKGTRHSFVSWVY
tara:strand:+ start:73 stop:669 length:597 start_codon:yes stop_codon:yes gene_type:complete